MREMRRHSVAIRTAWFFVAVACLLSSGAPCGATSAAERRAFAAAVKSFNGGWWEIAEKEFGEFTRKYPESEYRAEAVLRRAQACYRQRNFSRAVELLSANLNQAEKFADDFQFWLAEAHYGNSNFLAAAEAYGLVATNFPGSKYGALAAYDEALVYSKLGDWTRVAELLGRTNGLLQSAIRSNPTNQLSVDGALLLAEAQLAVKDYRAAEETLRRLASLNLPACLDWRRQHLLCRVWLRTDRAEEALQGATNLIAEAKDCGRRDLQVESVTFKAQILEQLTRVEEASAEYERNLGRDVPAEQRRLALLRIIELDIRQNRIEEATRRVESFLAQYPQDASTDAALIALGELHLKRYVALAETNGVSSSPAAISPTTNYLQLALAQFDAAITNALPTLSGLAGKALLDRGWCLWLSGRTAESQVAFEAAARKLPFSEDSAVARFKWADAQYLQKDFGGALTNYCAVTDDFSSLPVVKKTLLEPALYQIVRAALEANDVVAATNAMAKILETYPNSYSCQSAQLLVGQGIDRQGQPDEARSVFTKFEKRFPDSSLLPEVRLAVARTYEREQHWAAAIEIYDSWVTNFASLDALPDVQYRRAWANYRAGLETNALAIFTNLVAQFPTNGAAALAQNWVAGYYFGQGDSKSAEENYQLLFQKWPASELTYQARMMAGRAAVARLGFSDAVGYFTAVINDAKCPPNLVAQALFANGDATMRLEPADTNKPLANFWDAIPIFRKLQQLYPTNQLSVLAWGRIGDCYLQLAAQDPNFLTNAINAYQTLMDNPRADVSARSQAEVGLALVLDKQTQTKPEAEQAGGRQLALEHYLNVAYEKNLREGEKSDPFWVKEAGLKAAKLAEELQLWEQLGKDDGLYDCLSKALPPLAPSFETKKLKAKAHLNSPGT